MLHFFAKNKAFLIPYVIFLVISGIALFIFPKAELHLILNQVHHPLLHILFTTVTLIGEGIIIIPILICLLFIKYRYAIQTALSLLLAFTITQALKHWVFPDMERPKKFFEGLADLRLVPGVENWSYNSFPSGHTASAFAMCFAIALFVRSASWQMALFFIALLTGFSRVYLSQHFLNDVFAGSVVGVFSAMIVYRFLQNAKATWLEKRLMGK